MRALVAVAAAVRAALEPSLPVPVLSFFFYAMNLPAEAVAGLCAAGCVLASWGGVAPSSSCRWTRFALGRGGATLLSFFFFHPGAAARWPAGLGPCVHTVLSSPLTFLFFPPSYLSSRPV